MTWTDVFLGVIAAACLVMAVVQVGLVIAATRLSGRVERLADDVRRELAPITAHLNSIGRDAARAAALAAGQVERADKLFSDIAGRVEQTLNSVQSSLAAPAREGRALLSAFSAAVQAIRELRQNSRARQGRGDDEDALFI